MSLKQTLNIKQFGSKSKDTTYIVELSSSSHRKMSDKYLVKKGFSNPKRCENSKKKVHYEVEASSIKELRHIFWLCRKCFISYTYYNKKYARSSDYRTNFLHENEGPFRCRYCNKKLKGTRKSNKLEVDHLIPVDAAKKSQKAQRMLKKNGCSSVNDIKNLVPACKRCNRKKSNQMGLWYYRGLLGKYKIYWVFIYTIRIMFAALVIAALIYGCRIMS